MSIPIFAVLAVLLPEARSATKLGKTSGGVLKLSGFGFSKGGDIAYAYGGYDGNQEFNKGVKMFKFGSSKAFDGADLTGDLPEPRAFCGGSGDSSDLLVAFGISPNGTFLDSTLSYNLELKNWRFETKLGGAAGIPARAFAPFIVYNFRAYTFGGIEMLPAAAAVPTGPRGPLGTLPAVPSGRFFWLTPEENEAQGVWKEYETAVNVTARYGHSMVQWENLLVIFGGMDGAGNALSEVLTWKFEQTTDLQAVKVVAASGAAPALAFHSAAVLGDKMYVYGGYTGTGYSASLYTLDVPGSKWSLVAAKFSSVPPLLHAALFVYSTGSRERIVLTGGEVPTLGQPYVFGQFPPKLSGALNTVSYAAVTSSKVLIIIILVSLSVAGLIIGCAGLFCYLRATRIPRINKELDAAQKEGTLYLETFNPENSDLKKQMATERLEAMRSNFRSSRQPNNVYRLQLQVGIVALQEAVAKAQEAVDNPPSGSDAEQLRTDLAAAAERSEAIAAEYAAYNGGPQTVQNPLQAGAARAPGGPPRLARRPQDNAV